MRECWINVYPRLRNPNDGASYHTGLPCGSIDGANVSALGLRAAIGAKGEGRTFEMLRAAGVGYRLHVRLKPSRLDVLEADAREMAKYGTPYERARAKTRLQMIEAARAKGVR